MFDLAVIWFGSSKLWHTFDLANLGLVLLSSGRFLMWLIFSLLTVSTGEIFV
jgi:hypothetical protein